MKTNSTASTPVKTPPPPPPPPPAKTEAKGQAAPASGAQQNGNTNQPPAQKTNPAAQGDGFSQGSATTAAAQKSAADNKAKAQTENQAVTAASGTSEGVASLGKPEGASRVENNQKPGNEKASATDLVKNEGNGQSKPYNAAYPEASPNGKPGLGKDKEAVWNAAKGAQVQPPVSDEEAAVLTSQLQQEGGLDTHKANAGDATNYGVFNLNKDLLQNHTGNGPFKGADDATLKSLNPNPDGSVSPEALQKNVQAAVSAMREMGTEQYLYHVRGGGTAFDNPDQNVKPTGTPDRDHPDWKVKDHDNYEFARSILNNAQKTQAAQQAGQLGQDTRYASEIPNI